MLHTRDGPDAQHGGLDGWRGRFFRHDIRCGDQETKASVEGGPQHLYYPAESQQKTANTS